MTVTVIGYKWIWLWNHFKVYLFPRGFETLLASRTISSRRSVVPSLSLECVPSIPEDPASSGEKAEDKPSPQSTNKGNQWRKEREDWVHIESHPFNGTIDSINK